MSAELIAYAGASLLSGLLGSSQAKSANDAAKEAAERQYEYDVLSYTQNAQKLVRDYNHTVDSILQENGTLIVKELNKIKLHLIITTINLQMTSMSCRFSNVCLLNQKSFIDVCKQQCRSTGSCFG